MINLSSPDFPLPRQPGDNIEQQYRLRHPETATALALGKELYDRVKDGGPRRVAIISIGDHLILSAARSLAEPRIVHGRLPSRVIVHIVFNGGQLEAVVADYLVPRDNQPHSDKLQTGLDTSEPPGQSFAEAMDLLEEPQRQNIVFALQTATAAVSEPTGRIAA